MKLVANLESCELGEMGIQRRNWQCPNCAVRYRIPHDAPDPGFCPQCEPAIANGTAHADAQTAFIATIVTVTILTISCCATILTWGLTPITFGSAFLHLAAAVLTSWYFHTPRGKNFTRPARDGIVAWIDAIRRWNQEQLERQAQLAEEARLRAIEQERKRQAERERREAEREARIREIANATRPLDKRWQTRSGVDAERAQTYGVGTEFVYCYSFPVYLRNAELEDSEAFNIKVGMAKNDPIVRIQQQISASKTAMSASAVVLIVFQTDNCSELERWMHRRLERTPGSLGREWFVTNESELLGLFRKYLGSTGPLRVETQDLEASELNESDFL